MNVIRLVLKEAGGRLMNSAGAIDSDSNMFKGSSGNAPSDKIFNSKGNNPIMDYIDERKEAYEAEKQNDTPAETTTTDNVPETTNTAEEDVEIGSDEKLKDEKIKDTYSEYKSKNAHQSKLAGSLKNLDLDPKSGMNIGGSGGFGGGQMGQMFQGIMGASGGEGADMADSADMADMADSADMADMADSASDERLKRIFGDNEDAIKAFAKINAIEFVYNENAHEAYPNGEHQIDSDPHYGVKAQDLLKNQYTASAVEKDPNTGYLVVNTPELTMANSAVISEICKRIEVIEKVLGIKVV